MNRKNFLSLTSLGMFSLLFPGILFSRNRSESNTANVNVLLKQAADLRKQKKYNQAKQIYQQIITQFPNEIRAYDGMRKVLLSQKNKEWQVILLLKGALLLNPNNIELKQRLYNEYFRACLGNKKVKNLINFNGRLLSEVKQKYETFVSNHPNNMNVQKQYAKIIRLFDANADTQNPNQNITLKSHRKLEYKNFKNRFSLETTNQLETRLNNLIAKPHSKDRKPHIRELYKLTFQKLRKQKNNTEALHKAVTYFNTVEKNDPLFLKYIRDMAKLQKNYDVLITIETQNHTIKNNFWSALALLDVYIRKAELENSSIPAVGNTLIPFLESQTDAPNKKFELNTRKIKINILSNQLENAKEKILTQSKSMYRISNTHTIDRMNVLIAKYYAKSGDSTGKSKILNIVVNPSSYIDHPDLLIRSIALINQKRDYTKVSHIQNLQKLINKL